MQLGKMSMQCGKSDISAADFIALTDENENSTAFGVNGMEVIFGKTKISIEFKPFQSIKSGAFNCWITTWNVALCVWGINVRIDGSEIVYVIKSRGITREFCYLVQLTLYANRVFYEEMKAQFPIGSNHSRFR